MLELKQLELHDETSEIDVPSLPWLEEAQLEIYLETKDLSPEKTEEYWAKKRVSWQKTGQVRQPALVRLAYASTV